MTDAQGDRDVLLVTGGSRGIGAAIVKTAIRQGYAVCFSYLRDRDAAARLVDEARGSGADICSFQGDVAEPAFAAAFFDAAGEAFGPVTAVVNNAGVTGALGPFKNLALDNLRRTIDTNLLGTMLVAQEAIRRWQESATRGRMVNISSAAATLGAPHEYVHYAATKAAVEAFTVGLGKEVAPTGIRVNGVSPGIVQTGIHAAGGDPDRPARLASTVPIGRVGDPAEIASAVLWLLSNEASYVTGAILRVAGGR